MGIKVRFILMNPQLWFYDRYNLDKNVITT